MSRSFETTVALRYLWTARKRAHTAFLSLISTLGLAVGVATLIISLSLLSGLQGQIKDRLIASSPHLLIEPTGTNTVDEFRQVRSFAQGLGLTDVHPIVSGVAWAANTESGGGRAAVIRSYDPAMPPTAETSFGREWSIETDPAQLHVILTRDFAAGIGLTLGETVTIIAPRTRLTPFGPVPVSRQYMITRLLPASRDERPTDIFLPLDEAADLFGTNALPTSVEIYATSLDRIDEHKAALEVQFPNLQVKTWEDINRPLFLALRLEKVVMFATISLIIFVAALNLISSLSMLIVEKRPQVGVLRTLGASENSILRIFLGVGLLIGILGTIGGNIIGLGVAWAANRYELVPLPGEVYFVSHIPFMIDPADVIGVNVIALVLSVLATWYPARVASRLDPVVAIRDE